MTASLRAIVGRRDLDACQTFTVVDPVIASVDDYVGSTPCGYQLARGIEVIG